MNNMSKTTLTFEFSESDVINYRNKGTTSCYTCGNMISTGHTYVTKKTSKGTKVVRCIECAKRVGII